MSGKFGTVNPLPRPLQWLAGGLRPLIRKALIETSSVDLRLVRWRLDAGGCPGADVTALFPPQCEASRPSGALMDLAARVIARTASTTLRFPPDRAIPEEVHRWPGEHYRLLSALVVETGARNVVEIGTHTGLGTLALKGALQPAGRIATFDLIPWNQFSNSFLRPGDFEDGSVRQFMDDLGDASVCARHANLLRETDLIFVDAAKDGSLERRLLDNFESVGLRKGTLVVLDDIRLWNMLDIWRRIRQPKLDFTSFGHFTGTGLVEWGGDRS